ncbi:MAG: hypothetical protein GXX08_01040 [Firmicutes bacterium]|nr:hypothetical protein [Bacillota bacterium]
MRIGVHVAPRCLCVLTALLVLSAVSLPGLASDSDKPLDSAVTDPSPVSVSDDSSLDPATGGSSPDLELSDPFPVIGWRTVEVPERGHTGLLYNSGLMWSCDYVLEYIGMGDTSAAARVNLGRVIPGDTVLEYLIWTYRTDSVAPELMYGQVSYVGCDAAGIRLSERYCSVPAIASHRDVPASAGQIDWLAFRTLIDATKAVRTHTYAFPLEHRSIVFGPTGHLGLSIAIGDVGDTGAFVQLSLPLPADTPEAVLSGDLLGAVPEGTSVEPERGEEPLGGPEDGVPAETEPASELRGDISGAEPEPEAVEAEAAMSPFSSPESTAKLFLEAVMVDRDPVKAAQAWSPRIPEVVIKAVVNNEIEFFADRDSALLSSLLSSLEYVAQLVSETEAVVTVVEYDEQAVVGRLEFLDGNWLFIALGYQLDTDLNLSAEWKRLAGLE